MDKGIPLPELAIRSAERAEGPRPAGDADPRPRLGDARRWYHGGPVSCRSNRRPTRTVATSLAHCPARRRPDCFIDVLAADSAHVDRRDVPQRRRRVPIERCHASRDEPHRGAGAAVPQSGLPSRGVDPRARIRARSGSVAQEVIVRVYAAFDSFRGDTTSVRGCTHRLQIAPLNVEAHNRYRAPHRQRRRTGRRPLGRAQRQRPASTAQRQGAMLECVGGAAGDVPFGFAPALLTRSQRQRSRDAPRCARGHGEVVPTSARRPVADHAGGTRFPWLTTRRWMSGSRGVAGEPPRLTPKGR